MAAPRFPTNMSPELLERLTTFIDQKWGRRGCPMCGTNEWEANGFHFASMSPIPTQAFVTNRGSPFVSLSCRNCGNTVWINAFIAGLM